ncbi:MAG: glycerophosphodiester phosphodiesterase [Oscillospiraceae bacterium]
MKKALRIALPIAGVAAAVGAAAFMVAPGRAPGEKKAPFMGANIAHRGLHKIDRTVPENSMAAFRAAVESGYGVELDVHITADGRLVVFHDDSLRRMCGVEGKVEELPYAELKRLRLGRTDEGIPLLGDVLALVGGKAPVVLELKRGGRNNELCERVYELLRLYSGPVCVESFDPRIVRWWRKNAPEVLRGQLSCRPEDFGRSTGRLGAFAMGHLLTNFLGRPQFIAYGLCEKKPLLVRLCEKMGAMRVCWTSRELRHEQGNDAVIFEYYRPRARFK